MSTQQLLKRDGRFLSWTHSESIAASKTGVAVVIPPLVAGQTITTVVIGGTNTAKTEYTASSDALVAAGTAVWHEVAATAVGTTVGKITWPVTGLRVVTGAVSAAATTFTILI